MTDGYPFTRRLTLPLFAAAALTCNCEPSVVIPPAVPDECFDGTFWDGDAFVRVTHRDGILSAVGSPPVGNEWEILSYTGRVTERGLATGDAEIWRLAGDGREKLTYPLELHLGDGGDCTERNRLSYYFHFVSFRDGSYISGDFDGVRGED